MRFSPLFFNVLEVVEVGGVGWRGNLPASAALDTIAMLKKKEMNTVLTI